MRSDLDITLDDPLSAIKSRDDHREFYDRLADLYASSAGKEDRRWFGDKTPEHTSRVDDIRGVYPESPIVFICRDPRDVVVSLKRVPWIRCSARSAAYVWARYASVLEEWTERQDSRLLVVKYEDLVQDSVATLEKICQLLELRFEQAMADGQGDRRLVPGRELLWKSHSIEKINSTRVGRWRDDLCHTEIAQVERIAGKSMTKLGYVPATDRPHQLAGTDLLPVGIDLCRTLSSLTYQCLLSETLAAIRSSPLHKLVVGRPPT